MAWQVGQSFADRRVSVAGVVLLLLLLFQATGCVQRRMTVRSNPPGALVYVDDQPDPIGVTPVSHDFIYYGTRKFRLVKDGYETLTVMQPISPPWYQYVPVDFVAENLVPGQIRDHRCLDFQLKPQMVVPTEQLLARAEELRRGVYATAGMAPQPAAPPPGTPMPATAPLGVPNTIGPPQNPELIPTPPGVGGQPVRPLPSWQ
jgi:hypothetical protein